MAMRMRMSMMISSCTVTVATASANSMSGQASLTNIARLSSPSGSIVVAWPAMLSRIAVADAEPVADVAQQEVPTQPLEDVVGGRERQGDGDQQ